MAFEVHSAAKCGAKLVIGLIIWSSPDVNQLIELEREREGDIKIFATTRPPLILVNMFRKNDLD
jgi:hypothetical protein